MWAARASPVQEGDMNRYPRRLIEVDLPIRRISAHARREKSIRHGHISTLHIWWARRPLGACRAVILASLWPDPAPGPDDPPCPPAFVDAARKWMTAWATNHPEKASAESFSRLNAIRSNPAILCEQPLELRKALLDFIADFANWDNSTDKDYLETSRALVQAAHEALGGLPGTRPLVVDPFAGGGSIPLEALRVGADAFASDLNPVAVLLNKVVLEYIPKYGQRLADEVRKWGEWIKKEAEKELAESYPKDPDGATPVAYLWARTIRCEGPSCGSEVPLIRSLWLAKKANRSVALQLVPRPPIKRVDCRIIVKDAEGWVNQDDPKDRIEVPTFDGTVKRGSATCPCCGYTTPVDRIRIQLRERAGGADDARLLCVVTSHPGTSGVHYRSSVASDEVARRSARATTGTLASLECAGKRIPAIPDEPYPDESASGALSASVLYGIRRWGDLYPARQALALASFSRLVRRAGGRINDPQLSLAVTTSLSFCVSKLADYLSSLCAWRTARSCAAHTFVRQALPMSWDFAEMNPFAGSAGDWSEAVRYLGLFIEGNTIRVGGRGSAEHSSAVRQPLPDDGADCVCTDPPYYDAIAYADLSDYFYVWLRRILGDKHVALFTSPLSDKDDEIVQLSKRYPGRYKHKTKEFFEQRMTAALLDSRRVIRPSGIGVVVFAHKSTSGWEAMLGALIQAGWIVTASWAVDTERGARVNALEAASLASSVHIVCRPRENPDGSVRTDDVGDWRDVLSELPARIHDWMPRLRNEGVVGADAIFACLGPALEIFSRYSRVEKASGEVVTLREYLEHVWAAVSTEALSMIFDDADAAGLEPDARLTAMWLWTLGAGKAANGGTDAEGDDDEDQEEGEARKKPAVKGFSLEFDAARKIAQGLGIHLERSSSIVEVKGDMARLLPLAERVPFLFGKPATAAGNAAPARRSKQRKLFQELEPSGDRTPAGTGLLAGLAGRTTPGQTVLDRVHQALVLFGGNRGEALKQFLVEDRVGRDSRFWRLAQSLSVLYPTNTDEKRWVDGVLARKKGFGF